jgi:hypothetical protein
VQIAALVEGVAYRAVDVDGLFRIGRRVGGVEIHHPEIRGRRVENQRAQIVLRLPDLRVGDDDALLVAGDFSLRLHDVDRCKRPDLHPLLIVLQRLLRERQRLLLRLQVVDGVDEVPVGVPHVARCLGDDRRELDVRELAALLADSDLLPDLIDLEIAEQRLGVLEVQIGPDLRAVGLEQVCRGEARTVPGCGVAAAPRQHLVHVDRRRRGAVQNARRAARERARRLLRLRIPIEAGDEVRRPERSCLRDVRVLNLGVEPLNPDAEVLLEREPHGIVDRELANRFALLIDRRKGARRHREP